MKNVLITGSASGIGFEIARQLEKKYKVFLSSRRKIDKENYFSLDLATNSLLEYEELVTKAKNYFQGSIDILINCAGQYIYKEIEKMSVEEIDYLTNLNFKAPYILSKLVIGDMKQKKWGRIVNIGSISGMVGEGCATLYSSTKAALSGLTKSLALEVASYNITVNQINPGWVKTPLCNCLTDEEKQEIEDVTPLGRFIEPIEVANLCQYLISEEAKGMTGQNINLCAGLSIGS